MTEPNETPTDTPTPNSAPTPTTTETATPTPTASPTAEPTARQTATEQPTTARPTTEQSGPALAVARPRRVWGAGARLQGRVKSLGDRDSLQVRFRYRELNTETWKRSDPVTVTETGAFLVTVEGLTRQRYYRLQLVTEVDGETVTSDTRLFSTPSGSSPKPSEPWDGYTLGPTDGFAVMGQWLNNNTAHVVVRKPTRKQLETALSVDGPRVVVFETSGTIDLGGEDIAVPHGRCWIAGQVAPSPGITLTRGGLRIEGNRCVVQHLRVRPGDATGSSGDGGSNGITVAEGVRDTVLDHCSVSWAVGDGISVGPSTENTTVSNCLVAEGLRNAGSEGESGHAVRVAEDASNVALVATMHAFTNDHHPRLAGGSSAVAVNNLVHTYENGCRLGDGSVASLVGNVYEDPRTDGPAVGGTGEAYLSDNVVGGSVDAVGDGVTRQSDRSLWPEGTTALASDATKKRVLANAGAYPAERTNHDERVVGNVRSGQGQYVESQEAVGGYPSLPANSQDVEPHESKVRAWLYDRAVTVENEA